MRERRGEKKIFFSFLFVGATVSFLGGSALHEFDAALPLRSNGVTTVASSVFFSRFRGRKREDDAAGVGARAVPVKKRGGRRGEEEEVVVVVVVVLWGRSRAFDAAGVTTIVRRTWVKSRRPIRNHLCGACLFRSLLPTITRLFLLLHRLRSPAHRDARVVSTGPFLFCSLFSLLRSAVFPTRMSPKRTTDCKQTQQKHDFESDVRANETLEPLFNSVVRVISRPGDGRSSSSEFLTLAFCFYNERSLANKDAPADESEESGSRPRRRIVVCHRARTPFPPAVARRGDPPRDRAGGNPQATWLILPVAYACLKD